MTDRETYQEMNIRMTDRETYKYIHVRTSNRKNISMDIRLTDMRLPNR